ncbi:MAG: hypothetical protein JKY48_04110 [Flavobacteriales bacterium]|nr:hypothetical protein [Flavobacteriales bacterium]
MTERLNFTCLFFCANTLSTICFGSAVPRKIEILLSKVFLFIGSLLVKLTFLGLQINFMVSRHVIG